MNKTDATPFVIDRTGLTQSDWQKFSDLFSDPAMVVGHSLRNFQPPAAPDEALERKVRYLVKRPRMPWVLHCGLSVQETLAFLEGSHARMLEEWKAAVRATSDAELLAIAERYSPKQVDDWVREKVRWMLARTWMCSPTAWSPPRAWLRTVKAAVADLE